MGLARQDYEDDPMGGSRFHKVLVLTNDFQRLPALFLALILLVLIGIVALFWIDTSVPIAYAVAVSFTWGMLWMLPRAGRSFGPEKASTFAHAILMLVMLALLALLNAQTWLAYLVILSLTGIAFYSTWFEPFVLGVTQETLKTPGWSGEPLRLLHIGDLHLERISPRERRLNQLIEQLQPDVIVFSGDFVNLSYTDDPQTFNDIREIIGAWCAPYGVYCVPGTYTVEPLERVKQFVSGLDNLELLLDSWKTVEVGQGRLHILGMVTRHILQDDQKAFAHLMQSAPEGGTKLLLTHAPDVAYDADTAGFDLYLCGHTHGGQIRFPLIGAVFSGSHLGMDFVMGRRDLEHTTVYTTRGVGLEGYGAPRARFLCPPEIILWTIKGGQDD